MTKNTYLAREVAGVPTSRLVEITPEQWFQIIKENKGRPRKDRRFFIVSTIDEGDKIDRMYIETSYEEFQTWNVEKVSSDRNKRDAANVKTYSLDAALSAANFSFVTEALSDCNVAEDTLQEELALDSLKEAVKAWEPWAYDLLLCYEAGQKRSCTKILAQQYGISEQAMRKRKRRFEEFCKNFFEG